MAGLRTKTPSGTFGDLLKVENSNSGVDDTSRQVESGDGTGSALYIEKNSVKIQPTVDDVGALLVKDKDGNRVFGVDTSNDLITVVGHYANTQYAHFGIGSGDSVWAGAAAGTHYAVPFNGMAVQALVSGSTGTDPVTSYTITTTGDSLAGCLWYVIDDITLDSIVWWHGGDAGTGEVIRAHLVQYDIVISSGATSGDLSSGTVVASGADITNAGYEQAYYQTISPSTANIDSGKALLFFFRADSTVNSDYTINATVKYHLR